MSFVESTAPDITFGLPFELSSAATAAYSAVDGWDVSLGGLGFNLRPSPQTPYLRASEQVRKQQIDTSDEAGEQVFTSWWLRSQTDWTRGAGILWYEPGADEATVSRFETSHGVDVWTPGRFSLLKSASAVGSAEASDVYLTEQTVSGTAGYVKSFGTTCAFFSTAGSVNSETVGGMVSGPAAVAGRYAYQGHSAGIDTVDHAASSVAATWTAGSAVKAWWAKNRIICSIGSVLYSLGAGTSGAITAVGTALNYTPSDTNWVWTDVAEAGSAILASGYVNGESRIVAFTIENNGSGVPTLVGGSEVARMPPGEVIYAMKVYLGNVLVLGTSAGIRVGEVGADGQVSYGPLTVETANPVKAITFRDRFAYAALTAGLEDSNSGAVRIDLSVAADGADRRAWAFDMPVGTAGATTSIALVGERVVLAANRTVYLQSDTALVSSGWLRSGRIRYRTSEPKAFRLARLEVDINGGTAALTAITPGGTEVNVITFTSAFVTNSDVTIQVPNESVHQWLQFEVTITPDSTNSPVVNALSIKAAPAPGRVRLFQFPLSCFDYEADRRGREYGYSGGAYARLVALEEAEESALPVRVVDNRTGESFIGMVDGLEFSAISPPDGDTSGFGGIITATVRRL